MPGGIDNREVVMQPQDDQAKAKTRRVWIVIIVICLYACVFTCATLGALLNSVINPPDQRMFTSDGSRLYVANTVTGKTNTQVLAERLVEIGGEKASTSFSEGKLYIQVGDQVYWWQGKHVSYPIWCLRTKSVYFLVPESEDKHTVSIWKWSKPIGFSKISKKPIYGLFFLNMSLSQDALVAMIYDERRSSIFTCGLDGGNPKTQKASNHNFDAVMISQDHYILNEQLSMNRGADYYIKGVDVVEWFKKTDVRKPFAVEGRTVSGTVAFDGDVWVLFQKPTFRFYPWMISPGDYEISVAKLNRERTNVVQEIKLTGNKEEDWRQE